MTTHAANEPHIIPLKVYLGIGAILLVLTAITVAVSYVDLGSWNIVVALVIAAIKATLVALVFMHLLYDNKFYAAIVVISILFLVIFIGFTMIDTLKRGAIYRELASPINENAAMYDSLTVDGHHDPHGAAIDTSAAAHDPVADTVTEATPH